MDQRKATILALRTIIDDCSAQIDNGVDVWNVDPDTNFFAMAKRRLEEL